MKLHKPSASGVALVIVLGFLVIISALAVAFFSSVTTELKASRNFAGGVTTRQLSDSAVQVVIGQIADATTKPNEAWGSQPGMIRVFGSNGQASATADSFYKLYSSDNMVVTGVGALSSFLGAPDYNTSWDQNPALWTDLNAPVIVWDPSTSSSIPRFPIIDPRAYVNSMGSSIANPASQWNGNVEGFWYDPTPMKTIVGPSAGASAQRLPMPVKWIYVLQDGTLTAPTQDGTGTTANFTGYNSGDPRLPTQKNPIVGRIAFWTDDETSKININTAAGFADGTTAIANDSFLRGNGYNPTTYAGSYWDSPRFYTQFDYGQPDTVGMPKAGLPSGGLAVCQLLQNEFQRYPGHPATTSLAPVFKDLLTSEQFYAIVPRYSNLNLSSQPGSTHGGTVRIKIDNTSAGTGNTLVFDQLQPKQDRLYASLDELLFGAHGTNIGQTSYVRKTNDSWAQLPANTITPQVLDKLRFFITSQSRAPELNLYGQPRVTAWPVRYESTATSTNSGMNVFDNLILFCSTVGTSNVPPTGSRPDTTVDQSSGLYRYIFTRKEIVGGTDTDSTGNLSGTYVADWNQPRNRVLLSSYLPSLFDTSGARAIPGFGTTWNPKYNVMDQQSILTEIFDYIRCANSQDTTTSLSSGKAIMFAPRGYIMPSTPSYFNAAKGLGRMSTLCEATLVFYYAGPVMDTTNANGVNPNPSGPNPITKPTANIGWSKWDPASIDAAHPTGRRFVKLDPTQALNNILRPQSLMRAFVVFSTFDPMQGYAPKADPAANDPKLVIQASWEDSWTVSFPSVAGSTPLGFPQTAASTTVYRAPGSFWGGRNFGGYEGFMHTLIGDGTTGATFKHKIMLAPGVPLVSPSDSATAYDAGETFDPLAAGAAQDFKVAFTTVPSKNQEYYPFQSGSGYGNTANPVIVPVGTQTFNFNSGSGNVDVTLLYGGVQMQKFKLNFPGGTGWPVPVGAPGDQIIAGGTLQPLLASGVAKATTSDVTTWNATPTTDPNYGTVGNPGTQGMSHWYWLGFGAFYQPAVTARKANAAYSFQTSLQASWSFATRLAWTEQEDGNSNNPSVIAGTNTPREWTGGITAGSAAGGRWECLIQPGDTVRSLLYWDKTNGQTGGTLTGVGPLKGGDLRIGALTASVLPASFMPHPDYAATWSRACVLRGGDGGMYLPVGSTPAKNLAGATMGLEASLGNHVVLGTGNTMQTSRAFGNLPWNGGSNATGRVNGVYRADKVPGDWDTGLGDFPDGPFANKQDEGNIIYHYIDVLTHQDIYPIPYFTSTWAYQPPGDSFTSPSRQMPSPGMFGSLPSHVPEGRNWETLCFCPNTAGAGHPGNVDPKDHLLLDLFQMPVVEPYPISEPFSTSGKVNLNYRIEPFDYIRRSTALRGALYPLRVTAVPSGGSAAANTASAYYSIYKTGFPAGTPISNNFRILVDRDQTIKELDSVYDTAVGAKDPNSGFFKSASQICEQYLIPQGTTWSTAAAMQSWWQSNGDLTGDNEREKPYTDLYPRVTTKSNTYTVHMRVQTLRQIPRNDPAGQNTYNVWNEGKDTVIAEYRGSATIERYLDPADPRFTNGAPGFTNPDTQSLEKLYRFRTVITKKFSP